MAYDNQATLYTFGTHDFGAGGEVFTVLGPKGKGGRLVDYGVMHPTEAFTTDTLPAYVSVGTVADADAYGDELGMGTLAIDAGGNSLLTTYRQSETGYATALIDPTLPADTVVALHCTAPTGGTPAGIAIPFMKIIWDK